MNRTTKVALLGGVGVGKTSCLVTMLDYLKSDFFKNLNLQLVMESATSQLMMENKARLVKSLDKGVLENKDGIYPTTELTTYEVAIGKRGQEFPLPINVEFLDYPGEWISSTEEDRNKVIGIVSNSDVVIIPVDAASLMENEKDRQSDHILEILEESFNNLTEPKLVLFVPVKAEKYYDDESSRLNNKSYYNLLKGVQEKFEDVIIFLTSQAIKRYISIAITPIQTLGSSKLFYFNNTEEEGVLPVFVVTHRGVFAPKHVDQPLIFLISFILKRNYIDNRSGFLGVFKRLMDKSSYLNEAADELTTKLSYKNGGIKVLQNSVVSNF